MHLHHIEAEAFDERIHERLANGHMPDLRRAFPCDGSTITCGGGPTYWTMLIVDTSPLLLSTCPLGQSLRSGETRAT